MSRPGGITGKGFLPGRSGNPTGRPAGERQLLQRLFGDGERLFARLDTLRRDPETPPRVRVDITCLLIERLHGRAPQRLELEGRLSLAEILSGMWEAAEDGTADAEGDPVTLARPEPPAPGVPTPVRSTMAAQEPLASPPVPTLPECATSAQQALDRFRDARSVVKHPPRVPRSLEDVAEPGHVRCDGDPFT